MGAVQVLRMVVLRAWGHLWGRRFVSVGDREIGRVTRTPDTVVPEWE
jgi:hypothetical protein